MQVKDTHTAVMFLIKIHSLSLEDSVDLLSCCLTLQVGTTGQVSASIVMAMTQLCDDKRLYQTGRRPWWERGGAGGEEREGGRRVVRLLSQSVSCAFPFKDRSVDDERRELS